MTTLNYTLVMVLDAATADIIIRLEQDIAAVQGRHRLYGGDVRPHVTLGMFETLDLTVATTVLDDVATRTPAMPVTYGSLGIFLLGTAVVFAAPVGTRELLSFHALLHEDLAGASTGPCVPYTPGNWVPHTTLAADVDEDVLERVVSLSCRLSLPLSGYLDRLLLARYPSGPVLHSVPLG